MSEIKIGDKVWCSDYDDGQRLGCWINGQIVTKIENGRAYAENSSKKYSHRLIFLTTKQGEITSPEEVIQKLKEEFR